jgi:DNA-binding SARP family transcriptional activator
VLGLWTLGLRWTVQSWSQLCPPKPKTDPQQGEWFREAQHEYLKGHCIAAETLLTRLLARHPADDEARLLLASVQRRTGARNQARQTLTELQPVAAKWQWEIDAELRQLTELEAEAEDAVHTIRKAA